MTVSPGVALHSDLIARALHLPGAEPWRSDAVLALGGRRGFLPKGRAPSVLLLGCGAGETTAMLAAAGADVVAVDPDGLAAAATDALLRAADLPGRVIHAPFTQVPRDLPEFDFAAMPQGWSDVSDPGRAAIAALLAAHLRPGGALFLTHAVTPGGAEDLPLRQLARAIWARTDPGLGLADRGAAALAMLEDALPACHLMLRAHGGYEAEMAAIRALPPALAAERWFMADRRPESVSALGRRMRGAGLLDLAPADPMRLARDLDLSAEQQAMADASAPWPADLSEAAFLAAELADIAARRAMRADLLLKSAPAPRDVAQAGRVLLRRVRDVGDALGAPLVGFLGPHAPARGAYAPLLDAVPEDRAVFLAEIARRAGLDLAAAAPLVGAMIGQGALVIAASDDMAARIAPACARLNTALLARGGAGWLVAPALGGGVQVSAAAWAHLRAALARMGESPGGLASTTSGGILASSLTQEVRLLQKLGAAPSNV
ncbi:MAG: SAM-dependent methyltransferase [Paracoccaceae bacterium]|jgi:SAM-dependent methyltransferase